MSRKRVPTRAPRGAEIHMDVERMHDVFDKAGATLDQATQTERLIMAFDLADVALRAAQRGDPLSVFSWRYGTEELQTALTEGLQRFVLAGRRQVAEELQRQRDAATGSKLAEPLPPAQLPDPDSIAPAAAAALGIGAFVAGAMREAGFAAITAKAGPPATAAVLEPVISAAGLAALLRWSVGVHELVSLGRAQEAQARKGEIEDAVYSALLDGNTCEACEAMDGLTTTDLAEASGWTPHPDCAGGSRCRCVTVYEIRQ